MVGSAGTCQPAAVARRSQARRRAPPAYDAGVHLRPRLGPARTHGVQENVRYTKWLAGDRPRANAQVLERVARAVALEALALEALWRA